MVGKRRPHRQKEQTLIHPLRHINFKHFGVSEPPILAATREITKSIYQQRELTRRPPVTPQADCRTIMPPKFLSRHLTVTGDLPFIEHKVP